MPELAEVSIHETGFGPVVVLSGEIDLSNARNLDLRLSAVVDNAQSGLVIDLEKVAYIDSAGLQMLFGLAERLARRRQRLAIVVGESSVVLKMIQLVNLERVAHISESHDLAMKALTEVPN